MGYNDAVIIELSQVPCELICAICHELINNPVQTPCNHVFCGECITESVSVNRLCPIDRSQLTATKLIPIQFANPILYRIWNKIKLRCPYAVSNTCHWTGSPESFEAHMSACACSKESQYLVNSGLLAQNKVIDDLKKLAAGHLHNSTAQANIAMEMRNSMHAENLLLRQQITGCKVHVDTTYKYDINNLEELSELIFQDRQNPPAGIDRHRIYQCIWNITIYYSRYTFEEHPEIVQNLKLLLTIATTSNWFTFSQRTNIEAKLREHFT
mmetsp:Transcript_12741/g.12400  ORF Transcript_12741/g.12400 Transcript_12741/m.12400 type:complete len:269 (-) Transcript_12741:222-1028(-)